MQIKWFKICFILKIIAIFNESNVKHLFPSAYNLFENHENLLFN